MRNQEVQEVVFGRLMSPQEVFESTVDTNNMPEYMRHRWFLCGDVPKSFFEKFRLGKEARGFRVSVFIASTNTGYVVFTMQHETTQVRFLAQLGQGRIANFLEDASKDGLMVSLANDGGEQAQLFQFPLPQEQLLPVLCIMKRCVELDWTEALEELAMVTYEMQKTDGVPSALDGFSVEQAYPVLILPESPTLN